MLSEAVSRRIRRRGAMWNKARLERSSVKCAYAEGIGASLSQHNHACWCAYKHAYWENNDLKDVESLLAGIQRIRVYNEAK